MVKSLGVDKNHQYNSVVLYPANVYPAGFSLQHWAKKPLGADDASVDGVHDRVVGTRPVGHVCQYPRLQRTATRFDMGPKPHGTCYKSAGEDVEYPLRCSGHTWM